MRVWDLNDNLTQVAELRGHKSGITAVVSNFAFLKVKYTCLLSLSCTSCFFVLFESNDWLKLCSHCAVTLKFLSPSATISNMFNLCIKKNCRSWFTLRDILYRDRVKSITQPRYKVFAQCGPSLRRLSRNRDRKLLQVFCAVWTQLKKIITLTYIV